MTGDARARRGRITAIGAGLALFLAACTGGGTTAPSASSPSAPQGSAPASAPAEPTTAAECEGGYPKKDVRFLIPYSPGGGFDTWARLISPFLSKHLPNTPNVVVENKSGAGGLVGVTELYGSKPDGYTIAITEPGVLVTSRIAGTTEIDPAQLRAIGQVTVSPEVIVVAGNSPWKTIEDVKAAAGSAPVKMGHGGVAAINVVSFDALGIPWDGVFHEGSSESILSLIRGDSQIAVFPLTSLAEQIKAGEIKPVVLVGTPPAAGQPNADEVAGVPTLDAATGKTGIGGALEQHRIIVAPPGTPDCVVGILSDALAASLGDAELIAQATAAGLVPVPADAAAAQEIVDNTVKTLNEYADLIKEKVVEE